MKNPDAFANPSVLYEEIRDGDLLFREGKLSKIYITNGYISIVNDQQRDTIMARYFITDYQGSVRAVCDAITGAPMHQIEYLPSGMVFRRSNNYGEEHQKQEFCGKERIDMHDYSVYDSQARFQYAKIPRFLSMDPLCEKFYSTSPYIYCNGDPVNMVDPDGKVPQIIPILIKGVVGAAVDVAAQVSVSSVAGKIFR